MKSELKVTNMEEMKYENMLCHTEVFIYFYFFCKPEKLHISLIFDLFCVFFFYVITEELLRKKNISILIS